MRMKRLRVMATAVGVGIATMVALAPAASAHPGVGTRSATYSRLGATTVTTAPGIATTLLRAGIAPLPVLPNTGVGLSLRNGLQVSYTFPITSSTADLATASGDIRHAGGIYFLSRRAHLEIGRFDIDLAAGKVFATEVNFAAARIPVLDLDLSGLTVSTRSDGATVLSGITVRLDPAAAGALNSTFGVSLPEDGSLVFGTARVVLT
jgi:hypothetical protein